MRLINILLFFSISIILTSCYSFTGGSLPEHLKTIYIPIVIDKSGYGNPVYKDNLHQYLIDNMNRDGSLTVTNTKGDSQVSVTIESITESSVSLNENELETERKITVSLAILFVDNINKKNLVEKKISNYGVYQIAQAQAGRDEAVDLALKQAAEDIMFAIVSGW